MSPCCFQSSRDSLNFERVAAQFVPAIPTASERNLP